MARWSETSAGEACSGQKPVPLQRWQGAGREPALLVSSPLPRQTQHALLPLQPGQVRPWRGVTTICDMTQLSGMRGRFAIGRTADTEQVTPGCRVTGGTEVTCLRSVAAYDAALRDFG